MGCECCQDTGLSCAELAPPSGSAPLPKSLTADGKGTSRLTFPLLFPFLGAQQQDLGPALTLAFNEARHALRQFCSKNAQLNLQHIFSQAGAGVSLCSLKKKKKESLDLLCSNTTWSNFETFFSIHVTTGQRQTEKSSQFLDHWVNQEGWICLSVWIFLLLKCPKCLTMLSALQPYCH